MRKLMKKIRSIRALAADNSGVALIEFAFIAPMMGFLIISAVELAYLAQIHMRVSEVANTVSDNASRVTRGIDEVNIREVFAGANVLGEPMDFEENGRIVLSSLQENGHNGSREGQVIDWQRCWGDLNIASLYGEEGKGRDDNSLEHGMGRTGNEVTSEGTNAVIFAEVSYEYTPLFLHSVVGEKTLRYESAFSVRDRNNRHISNGRNLQVMDCD